MLLGEVVNVCDCDMLVDCVKLSEPDAVGDSVRLCDFDSLPDGEGLGVRVLLLVSVLV